MIEDKTTFQSLIADKYNEQSNIILGECYCDDMDENNEGLGLVKVCDMCWAANLCNIAVENAYKKAQEIVDKDYIHKDEMIKAMEDADKDYISKKLVEDAIDSNTVEDDEWACNPSDLKKELFG